MMLVHALMVRVSAYFFHSGNYVDCFPVSILRTPSRVWRFLVFKLKKRHLKFDELFPCPSSNENLSVLNLESLRTRSPYACGWSRIILRRSPIDRHVQSLAEDFPSRSTSCVTPSWLISPSLGPLVLALPSVNPHGKSLLDLSLTWRSAFRSDQKENSRNGCKRTLEKLSMLNKRRRWFHSSREKLSLVRMSASWFLVSTYLIWLWGLDTCLTVWLRPSIIILMTASLSSENVEQRLILRRMCVGGNEIHI